MRASSAATSASPRAWSGSAPPLPTLHKQSITFQSACSCRAGIDAAPIMKCQSCCCSGSCFSS
jgi:hypothetical protein